MNDQINGNENIWEGILSREENRIWQVFSSLDEASQSVILNHLVKMKQENGWHPEQVKSASLALDVIRKKPKAENGH